MRRPRDQGDPGGTRSLFAGICGYQPGCIPRTKGFIAEKSAFYCRAFLSGDICVAGTPPHTGLHSGYRGPMSIAAGGLGECCCTGTLSTEDEIRMFEAMKTMKKIRLDGVNRRIGILRNTGKVQWIS